MRSAVPYLLLLIAIVLGTSSCASMQKGQGLPKKMTAQKYLEWYSSANYPFRDTMAIEGVTYVCTLVPTQVEIARQVLNQLIEKAEAETILKEENVFQFELQVMLTQTGTDILHYKLEGNEDVSSRTSYFSFGIKKDLSLQLKKTGKVECTNLHFERGIAGLPVSKLMAYFPSEKEAMQSLVFYDRIFAKREIIFDFSTYSNHLPQLKL